MLPAKHTFTGMRGVPLYPLPVSASEMRLFFNRYSPSLESYHSDYTAYFPVRPKDPPSRLLPWEQFRTRTDFGSSIAQAEQYRG